MLELSMKLYSFNIFSSFRKISPNIVGYLSVTKERKTLQY